MVPAAANRPQHPREQRGNGDRVKKRLYGRLNFECFPFSAVVPTDYDHIQLLRGDQLFLDVRRGLLPSHRHRHDLFNR